jgi:hypothetical protein
MHSEPAAARKTRHQLRWFLVLTPVLAARAVLGVSYPLRPSEFKPRATEELPLAGPTRKSMRSAALRCCQVV